MLKPVVTGGTVHIVQRMELGGIQTLILDMINAGNNPADRIYSLEASPRELIAEWPLLEGVKDRLFGFERGDGLVPSLARQIAAHLKLRPTHTVIAHHIGPMLYGVSGARFAKIPHIIHVEHDVWHYENRKHRIYAGLISRLFRPRHVAVSQQVANGLRPIIGDRPIHIIPPAIDTQRFKRGSKADARKRLDLPIDIRLVGTAGRLVEVKAYDNLIKAISSLPENVHLALAGEGPDEDMLRALAAEKGVAERVHFLGLRSDLEHIIPAFDVFCLSSHNEGLPRVVLEAQACDVPVVATNVGAMHDAVCPVSGQLVASGDIAALALALEEQLDREIPRDVTRAHIVEKYSIASMMKAYQKVLEGV